MHTNATLARVNGGTDPTQALGPLAPIDHIRRQVALSLFGDPAPVSAIGRFQIQRMIGAGGMGVVYAATDPQLGRTVALKLIQPTTAGERATERLLREAQAMARLQHPNVVGIHEAGIVGGHVYLAMEYVDGGTLDAWLHAQPRAWQDVLAVLLQAGEGLVAAHAAGLVHRDFKPANVLMSRARARISDFGLARTDAAAEELERTAGDDELLLGQPLTRTDVVLGTPAYMAPEQIRGEVATAASDQFAFAVVTYEALAGHRPFQGDTIGALLTAIEQGRIHPLKRDVPPTLLSVLRRALAVDPAARYPDMTALLTALRGVRTGRRLTRRFMLSAAGAALGLGLLVLGSLPEKPGAPGRSPPLAACDDDPLAEIWDDARRTHVAHALSSGTDPALPVLDAYAVALRAAHRRQCDAAPQALGWTDTCLADRRTALADLTHAILVGSPELRTGAAAAARELLPSLTDCEQPVPYLTLVSEAHRDQRWTAWQLRLAHADAFGPRPTTRAPRLHLVGATLGNVVGAMRGTGDPRVVHETGFATLVAGLHAEDRTDRDPLATAVDLGRRTADTNHADLAARAWVLAAELLEARPHAEGAREEAWTAAAKALGQLPKAHPLRLRLHRDLAHVELAHARHATPAGACSRGEADFAACRSIFTAISDLTDVAADPSATPADLELLARAHDHAGDAAAATATRARATPIDLDERSLGFLEFVAAAAPDVPDPAAGTRCTDDDARCEVERALASRLAADPVRLIDGARYMMSVQDGTPRGIKVYAVRAGASLNLLGFKNGDLVTAIDGAAPNADDFVRKLQDLLARGAGTLEVQRKGAATVRRISVR